MTVIYLPTLSRSCHGPPRLCVESCEVMRFSRMSKLSQMSRLSLDECCVVVSLSRDVFALSDVLAITSCRRGSPWLSRDFLAITC